MLRAFLVALAALIMMPLAALHLSYTIAAMMHRSKPRDPEPTVARLAFVVPLCLVFALAVGALFEMQWTAANYRAVYGVAK